MMLNFKPLTISDRFTIDKFLKKKRPKFCLQTFEGLYIWRTQLCIHYAVYKNFLIIRSCFDYKYNYIFPIGEGPYDEVLDVIHSDALSLNIPYSVYQIQEDEIPLICDYANFHHFKIEPVRDYFEYWYDVNRMISLKGSKLQSKRNHINYFKQHYVWSYQMITHNEVPNCIRFIETWEHLKHEPNNFSLHEDDMLFIQSLKNMEILNLKGGILTVDGQIVALSLGLPLNDEVYMILFEKARSDIKGAYPMIFREFVQMFCQGYKYVDRLEDTGDEGLRQAKLSYQPDILQPVYRMRQP